MVSIPSRLSEASATSLICAGRLLRPRCCACCRIDIEAEFGRDHDAFAERRQRLAHQLLVGEGSVDFGGVEERHAALDRAADQRDSRLLIDRRTITEAEPHAAEADGGYFQFVSKFALLHCLLLRDCVPLT